MSRFIQWYAPRSAEEKWQISLMVGQCIGWDACRLFGDGNIPLAIWDAVGSLLMVTAFIAIARSSSRAKTDQ